MAVLIPAETFAKLEDQARQMLDEAREISRDGVLLAPGADDAEAALTEETQACASALMALCRVTPLAPEALFVAIGAAAGVILAQTVGSHALLLKLMRGQEKASYDEVIRASTPPTETRQ
jgi:hypothetical protein